jgi:hypothetical protein
MRKNFALAVSTLLLIVLPAGGVVGGGYAGAEYAKPVGPVCGIYVFPFMMSVGFAALLGLIVGIGTGWMCTLGAIRWANRCGLSEVRDELPPI